MADYEYMVYDTIVVSNYLLESRIVVAYVDSVISRSGWHLSIQADLILVVIVTPVVCKVTSTT